MPTVQNPAACAVPQTRQSLATADHQQQLRGTARAEVESAVAAQGRITHESEAQVNIGAARVTRSSLVAASFADVLQRIQNPDAVCSVENSAAFVGRHDLEQEFDARVTAQTRAELLAAAGVTFADGQVDIEPVEAQAQAPSPRAPAQLPPSSPAQLPPPSPAQQQAPSPAQQAQRPQAQQPRATTTFEIISRTGGK